jgi:hypothetical protein
MPDPAETDAVTQKLEEIIQRYQIEEIRQRYQRVMTPALVGAYLPARWTDIALLLVEIERLQARLTDQEALVERLRADLCWYKS